MMSTARAFAVAVALSAAVRAAGSPNPSGADGPLTLEQAVATAIAHQPLLKNQKALTRAAVAGIDIAAAPLFPQTTVSAGFSRSGGKASSVSPAGTGIITQSGTDTLSYGLSASQLLIDFGQNWYARGSAVDAAEAQRQTEHDTYDSVVLTARSAWFTAAADRDLVIVATDTLANREIHLKQTEGFVEVGTHPEIDLAQARSDRATAQVQLITAQNNLATALATLNQAMGVGASIDYELAPTAFPPIPGEDGPVEPLIDEALSHRSDLQSLVKNRVSQLETARSFEVSYLPTLSAVGRANEVGPSVSPFDQPHSYEQSWTVGLSLSWPIWQGGKIRGEVDQAFAEVDSYDAQIETVKLAVVLAVQQAWLSVKAAKASLDASGEALTNAKDQLRLAEARYVAGLGSGIELNDSQVAETNAAAQEVQARFNLATARAQLERALARR